MTFEEAKLLLSQMILPQTPAEKALVAQALKIVAASGFTMRPR
jgi:hypothetical protein